MKQLAHIQYAAELVNCNLFSAESLEFKSEQAGNPYFINMALKRQRGMERCQDQFSGSGGPVLRGARLINMDKCAMIMRISRQSQIPTSPLILNKRS